MRLIVYILKRSLPRHIQLFWITQALKFRVMKDLESNSIAVLPFVNMSSNEDNEYFSDGMTEEIINALAKIKELKVTSRTSSFFFKKKNIPISQIGQELNVSTILEGSVRLSGNMMRITAQLINVAEDIHFWSETWDRKTEDVFAIQDEISLLIAEKLRENTGHFQIQNQLIQPQTSNLEAYENYLKGKYHYLKWNQTDVEVAIGYYEKALELDNKHAESYIGLGTCYVYLASTGFLPHEETFRKAKKYANKALIINDQLQEVHFALGGISFWYEWNFETACAYMEKVLRINPSHSEAHYSLAMVYMILGKSEIASAHIKAAINLDPISQNQRFTESWIYYMLEQYPRALELTGRILAHSPELVPALIIQHCALILSGRQTEVLRYFENNPHPAVDISSRIGLSAIAHVFTGDHEQKEKYVRLLHEQLAFDHADRALAFIFLVHAASGETDLALDYLKKCLESRSPTLLFLIDDPLINPIKGNQKYKEIRKSLLGEKEDFFVPQSKPSRIKKPLLDEVSQKAYSQKLLSLIDTETPYLEPNLSLKKLADLLNIHPNQLSWLLNERFNKSFNDFINHYRVAAFKRLAVNPHNSHLTLIGLAYESGFNSKTVFNTYFKKEAGMTPKAWLKSAIEQ